MSGPDHIAGYEDVVTGSHEAPADNPGAAQIRSASAPELKILAGVAVGTLVIAALYFSQEVLIPITLAVMLSRRKIDLRFRRYAPPLGGSRPGTTSFAKRILREAVACCFRDLPIATRSSATVGGRSSPIRFQVISSIFKTLFGHCRSQCADADRRRYRPDLGTGGAGYHLLAPAIGRAMLLGTLVDRSISLEWIANVGRRDTRTRVRTCCASLRFASRHRARTRCISITSS
jgi:hypothetical protein